MDIQLSISLLASDRPAALERCLDSLRPLLMQVPSELIIIATGTDERVRETASRYTDQIIPFTWCNDFSAARNTGLRAAKGEWFMYLDDDEWFEDTSEIRDFFLTGEYKNYGTAFYRVRNYLNWSGIQHFDFHALRLAKITASLRFENPIHEELVPRVGNSKFFDAYVHHYGYIVDRNRTDAGKTSRNIPLLLKNIRRNPDYIKNYIQLTQEYYVRKEWEKAEEYCRKGRRLCRGKAGAEWYIQWFQVYWADIQSSKNGSETARKEILSILEKERPAELTRLCLYRKMLLLCTQLENYDETLHYGKKFEELLIYMGEHPGLWKEQSYGDINEQRIKNPEELTVGRLRCAESAFFLKDSGQAAEFLMLLPWEDETQVQRYYPLFDSWKEKDRDVFQKILEKLPAENAWLQFQKVLHLDSVSGQEQKETQFLSCIAQTVSPYLQQKILTEAVLSGMDLSAFAEIMDLNMWNGCMQQLVEGLPVTKLADLERAAERLKKQVPLHGLWMEKLVQEKQLIRGFLAEELSEKLSEYCRCVLNYYKGQYREELFEGKSRVYLPADCRFALFISEAMEYIEAQRFPEAVNRFRSALKFYPAMTGVIQEIIRRMKNSMDNPARNAGEEFQMLAGQMKQTLFMLIEAGQYAQALPVMQQLCTLLPEDLELLKMRQTILRKNNENQTGSLSVLR